MDAAKRGASALESGQPAEAVDHYTNAIREHPEAADYYIQRSAAYRRTRKNDEALADAETAVFLANKRARRELIAKAQFERALVLYNAERFGDANQCFLWSEEYNPNDKRIGIWKIKAEGKIKALPEDDENRKISVNKLPAVDSAKINEAATPANSAKPSKHEESSKPVESSVAAAGQTLEKKVASLAVDPASKIRHDWYQDTATVTVTLLAKNVSKEKVNVDLESSSLSISFPLSTGADYDFSLQPLFGDIDVASSTYKVMTTKVEFILKKKTPGLKWAKLERDEADEGTITATATVATAPAGHSYPTSSRTGPKNWDVIIPDDEDEVEGDAANDFFKKLYKTATPDVQRAMMKSFTESNGTSLSTNWEDVEKQTFQTEPPDGMEAKKW